MDFFCLGSLRTEHVKKLCENSLQRPEFYNKILSKFIDTKNLQDLSFD